LVCLRCSRGPTSSQGITLSGFFFLDSLSTRQAHPLSASSLSLGAWRVGKSESRSALLTPTQHPAPVEKESEYGLGIVWEEGREEESHPLDILSWRLDPWATNSFSFARIARGPRVVSKLRCPHRSPHRSHQHQSSPELWCLLSLGVRA
jgi:hypothetical protein